MSEQDYVDTIDNNDNNSNDNHNDDEYEKVCFVCHRPESGWKDDQSSEQYVCVQ